MAALIVLATSLSLGCEGGGSAGGDTVPVQLSLSLPGGVTVNSVSWQVLSATGAALAAGITNTSNTSATPSLSFSVPPGIGDKVHMTATTTAGASCAGTSAPFDVLAGQRVSVDITITCGEPPPSGGLGSVIISGTLVLGDSCPILTAWTVSPQQTSAGGGSLDVSVTATDADTGETLSYAWAATAGSFVDPTAHTTQYICGPAGTQTLSLTISDNHQPISCTVNVSFPVVDCS